MQVIPGEALFTAPELVITIIPGFDRMLPRLHASRNQRRFSVPNPRIIFEMTILALC